MAALGIWQKSTPGGGRTNPPQMKGTDTNFFFRCNYSVSCHSQGRKNQKLRCPVFLLLMLHTTRQGLILFFFLKAEYTTSNPSVIIKNPNHCCAGYPKFKSEVSSSIVYSRMATYLQKEIINILRE